MNLLCEVFFPKYERCRFNTGRLYRMSWIEADRFVFNRFNCHEFAAVRYSSHYDAENIYSYHPQSCKIYAFEKATIDEP